MTESNEEQTKDNQALLVSGPDEMSLTTDDVDIATLLYKNVGSKPKSCETPEEEMTESNEEQTKDNQTLLVSGPDEMSLTTGDVDITAPLYKNEELSPENCENQKKIVEANEQHPSENQTISDLKLGGPSLKNDKTHGEAICKNDGEAKTVVTEYLTPDTHINEQTAFPYCHREEEKTRSVAKDIVEMEKKLAGELVLQINTSNTEGGNNGHKDKGIPPTEPEVSGLEDSSDYSELPSEPGDLIEVDSSSNSISLAWRAPIKGSKNVENYEIKYKEYNRKGAKWIPVVTETSRRTTTVPDLKCGTEYEFKIRAVNINGDEGPFGSVIKLSTRLSLAKSVQMGAKKIKDGNPAIFKLPLSQTKSSTNYAAKTRKCTFGQPNVRRQEKTIMLVGATGSGKSTLIDGMINYITDVSWEDDFRFSLIDLTEDEKTRHKNQAESQTEWITCYTIHEMDGSKIDYDLNIIDTPGFGDTRGIVRDKVIVDQIREFFTKPGEQGIAFLDAVCFVTQAPLARLTPPQRYIFDSILSVFGQDIAKNIFILITFSDGNEPPVREALKAANVPFQKSFKFNNSALFATAGNNDEAKFGILFWKMGRESFRIFFDELKSVESKSLQLTTEVLQLRKNLEATIQGLQPQITEGINKLNTIRQEQEILKRHKADIAANRNFDYEVDEIHMRKIDLNPGTHVTNCLTCNRTCHFPCGIPDDKDKRGCAAMRGESCNVCPGKCHWSVHKNNMFRFETYPVKVKKTYDELKAKYEIAQQEEKKQRSVIGKVKNAFSYLGGQVMKMVNDVRCYINKLNEIALRPNPLSDIDYIDLLIESEKNERKYGWEKRMKLFYRMREEAELVAKTTKANYKPWGEDDKILNEME